MFSFKQKKILSLIITTLMVFPQLTFAAEEATYIDPTQITSPTMPDASTVVPDSVKQQYAEAQSRALLQAMYGSALAGGGSSIEAENEQRYTAAKKKAAQQENTTTSTPINSLQFTISTGEIVRVFKNPCYGNCTATKACPDPKAIIYQNYTSNTNGTTSYSNGSWSCNVEWMREGGGEITQEIRDKINRMGATNISDASSPLEAAIKDYLVGNSDSANLSAEQRSNQMVASGLNAMQQKNLSDIISHNAAMQKAAEDKENESAKKEEQKMEELQKERKVLSDPWGDAPYTVKLTPPIPTVSDMLDVNMTLIPKNKTGKAKNEINDEKEYTISARYFSYEDNEYKESPVLENEQFLLEYGSFKNRTPGTREVEITYTYKNGTKKRSKFTYTVGQVETFLTEDGNMALNTVRSAISNADIFAVNGTTFAVAGKIEGAIWDSSKGKCVLTIADEHLHENAKANVITNNLTQEDCKSAIGTYASMDRVKANFTPDGEIEFEDYGSKTTEESKFNQTEAAYEALQQKQNQVAQQQGIETGIRYVDNIRGYVRGGYGEINKDFILLKDGTIWSVDWNEDAGTWMPVDAKGNTLSLYSINEALAKGNDPLSMTWGTDPEKCTVTDADGNSLIKENFDNSDILKGDGVLAAYQRNEARVKGTGKSTPKTGSGKTILDAAIDAAAGIAQKGTDILLLRDEV